MISLIDILAFKKIDHPFSNSVKKLDRKLDRKPDNIVYAGGKSFVRTEFEDGFEETLWTGSDVNKSVDLTPNDIVVIKNKGLSEQKYMKLKPFWASGYSAAKASKEFKGVRGYGKRTLESYWSAMNSAFNMTAKQPQS